MGRDEVGTRQNERSSIGEMDRAVTAAAPTKATWKVDWYATLAGRVVQSTNQLQTASTGLTAVHGGK